MRVAGDGGYLTRAGADMNTKNQGIYPGISNDEYHKMPGISSTYLRQWTKCPLSTTSPTPETKAMAFGSAAHKYILERDEFFTEFAVAPKVDRRTKSGKEEYERFVVDAVGKTIIADDEFCKILEMRDALFAHPVAVQMLSAGDVEQSIFWTDQKTGLGCKCRPDLINGVLIDYKTTTDASPHGFSSSIQKYGYHQQAAHYIDGYNAVTSDKQDQFCFIAQESKPPYLVGVYFLDEDAIEIGREKNRRALYSIANHAGALPSYNNNESAIITLPGWALYEHAAQERDELVGFE
jgi:hypothetical protein